MKEYLPNQNPVITLTSDLGYKDYYSSIIKGGMLSLNPNVQVIDITHSIGDFNIAEGAFVFKNAYQHFPPDTIHLLLVNTEITGCDQFLVFYHKNQYFIGPDNGIFSLVFESLPEDIYVQQIDWDQNFPIKDTCTKLVAHILSGKPLSELSKVTDSIQKRITLHPVVGQSLIRGSIVHIDGFENVIININRDLFEQVCDGRDFEIYYKRWEPITQLYKTYKDVGVGEILALFNSSNYLEIAVNMGKAATLLGLQIDDTIQVDFLN